MSIHATLTGASIHETKLTLQSGSPIVGMNVASAAGIALLDTATNILYRSNSTSAGDWSVVSPSSQYYDLFGRSISAPASNEVLMNIVFTRSVSFTAGFTGSLCRAGVAATAQTDFLIKLNGTTKITMRFAALGTAASFVSGTAFTAVPGDLLTVVAPAVPDSTLANMTWTFNGSAI
jgi:hypothetical protein